LNIRLTAVTWPVWFVGLFGPLRNHLGDRRFADDEEVETEMRKWLRQQSDDFYAAGFDALVKQLNKRINVGGEYVEK
jgi:hypothetical protein